MKKETVIYKEPKSYFTPEMLKFAKEWDKTHKKEEQKKTDNNNKKK